MNIESLKTTTVSLERWYTSTEKDFLLEFYCDQQCSRLRAVQLSNGAMSAMLGDVLFHVTELVKKGYSYKPGIIRVRLTAYTNATHVKFRIGISDPDGKCTDESDGRDGFFSSLHHEWEKAGEPRILTQGEYVDELSRISDACTQTIEDLQ
jgi:hypothetical protein